MSTGQSRHSGGRVTGHRRVFAHACKMGLEGIVSKRLGSRYTSGRSKDWLKFKNPDAPAVKREAEEDWAGEGGDDSERAQRPLGRAQTTGATSMCQSATSPPII